MLNHLQAKVEALGLGPGDAVAQTASQCFDISIWQLLAPLVSGGRVELIDDETARDPLALLPRLAERGVTVFETVPSLLGAGLAALAGRAGGPPALPELRWLLLTGEALPPALARDWLAAYPAVPVLNAYGPTECSDDVTHHRIDRPPDAEAAAVPIGRPLPNTEIHLVDPRLRRVPLGVAGELAVGGAGVGRGYLGDPRRTAAAFVPDPFSGRPGARLYRTGDLARRRRDGAVEFIGRLDHQVKVRGFRIELGEIEAALGRQPEVAEAVVAVRRAAAGTGETLVGYVRPAAGAEPEPAALRRGLERLLPDYMVPTAWVVVDRFPLTANGKIDRATLPEPAPEAAAGAEPADAPRDTLELKLAEVWRTALGVPALGVHDDFFDLGGHSLLAVRLMAMVEKETGREVPLSALFAGPTVAELAAVLRRSDLGELWSPLVEIQPAGPLPPLFAIHPTGGDVLCYYHLARLLGRDQPLYGLQARGLDGRQPPLDDMPEIAAFYLDTLREVQPEGPYYLVGWSFGGLAAFDMARQLREAGERVAFLGIFDSLAPLDFEGDDPYGFSREVWAEWFVLIAGELEAVFGAGLGVDRDAYLRLEPEAQLDDFLERMRRAEVMPSEGGQAIARGFWRVHEGNTRAMWRFAAQARVYPDTLTLFRTGGETLLADSRDRTAHDNPVYGWDRLVDGKIDVFRVPGNHNNLLQPPHVESLARRLTEALELARRRAGGRHAAAAQSAEDVRS
jgi:thioesterase domain-containing protein/acyl carrier protein